MRVVTSMTGSWLLVGFGLLLDFELRRNKMNFIGTGSF